MEQQSSRTVLFHVIFDFPKETPGYLRHEKHQSLPTAFHPLLSIFIIRNTNHFQPSSTHSCLSSTHLTNAYKLAAMKLRSVACPMLA
jgi:hypothetical protein